MQYITRLSGIIRKIWSKLLHIHLRHWHLYSWFHDYFKFIMQLGSWIFMGFFPIKTKQNSRKVVTCPLNPKALNGLFCWQFFCNFCFDIVWWFYYEVRKRLIAQAYWDISNVHILDIAIAIKWLILYIFRCHNVRPGPDNASWNCALAGGNHDHLRPDQSRGPRQCATCITAETQVRESHINIANRDVIDLHCCRPHALCQFPSLLTGLTLW